MQIALLANAVLALEQGWERCSVCLVQWVRPAQGSGPGDLRVAPLWQQLSGTAASA